MPKITAATVAEHRAVVHAALIRAGEEVLISGGLAAFSPTSVSERAGIARSSFYDYFPAKDDLLVAIAIHAMERWDAEIEQALHGAEPGHAQLRALVDATMRMTAEGKHAIAGIVREAELSPSSVDDLMILHDALLRPVTRVLADLGADTAPTSVMLIHGVLGAGVQLVSHGAGHRVVAEEVFRLLTRGIIA
jgi:AcrR family transcriptional regulator